MDEFNEDSMKNGYIISGLGMILCGEQNSLRLFKYIVDK